MPRREGGCQEASPVKVWEAEKGSEEVIGGTNVELGEELHAKEVERCLQASRGGLLSFRGRYAGRAAERPAGQ